MNPGHPDELVLDIGRLADWLGPDTHPTVVAKPRGIESYEQLLDAAQELASNCKASLLLAKPQDVWIGPASASGNDQPVLHWLCDAKRAIGLPMGTEVANAPQVDACLAAGVDVLLIGARVTADPHNVKEIAAALRGGQVPVLVENAAEPDVGIWARALELLNGAGVCEMAAIHRGFSFSDDSAPRYQPRWEIPIELRRIAPHLPMLCDLSPTMGDPESASDIAQTAMDLDMDGLVAEVHILPIEPLRKSSRGLTVQQLEALLSKLEVRRASPSSTAVQSRIGELRKAVDSLDRGLLDTLSQRQEVVDRIAKLKQDEDVTVLQLQRWREIVRSRTDYGRALGLDDELVQMVLEVIHSHAIARQRKMLKERSAEPGPSEDPAG